MNAALVTFFCLVAYFVAYRFYARFLGRRVFALSHDRVTPAHQYRDGVDYVPTDRRVLLGHHYVSIAGLSPMLGPAIAVIWGWLPALLWVVLGAIFIGAVHDFGALVVSIRARGMSIGKVAEGLIGPRAKTLFHILIVFLIGMAMGVFVYVVAVLFAELNPEAVVPSFGLIGLAVLMGSLMYKRGLPIGPLTLGAFLATLVLVVVGIQIPVRGLSVDEWSFVLIMYAFAASVLPVWSLLQPRDYINSLLLYLALAMIFVGLFILRPEFVAPAVRPNPPGAPPILPFVFIVIACGAVSGFHCLVSSGTTAKQINRETDAPVVGYGGMIGESLLGLTAVLATTAGFVSATAWEEHYGTWDAAQGLGNNIGAFVDGAALFVSQLGIPLGASKAFMAVVVVSFALTTLDSATRILRFNISEMGETFRIPILDNRVVASFAAVAAIAFFAFFRVDGRKAGLILWELFGTTNQILGGLALLAVAVYLIQRGRPAIYVLIPMVFMLLNTVSAMVLKIADFWEAGHIVLLGFGAAILTLSLWLTVEAVVVLSRHRGRRIEDLMITFAPSHPVHRAGS